MINVGSHQPFKLWFENSVSKVDVKVCDWDVLVAQVVGVVDAYEVNGGREDVEFL